MSWNEALRARVSPRIARRECVLLGSLAALLLITSLTCPAQESPQSYAQWIQGFDADLTSKLASLHEPNDLGAMGRNRRSYFHVRFQLGLHRLADAAIVLQDADLAERFVRGTSYSFEHQESNGGFELQLPRELEGEAEARETDLLSGTAFFAASCVSGWYALEQSEWFQQSDEVQDEREQLSELRPKLQPLLRYLLAGEETLARADSRAPNRLLFNALAFASLGKVLESKEALAAAERLKSLALEQVDREAGYFIEGGGYDSSYNAVATALAFRLAAILNDEPLRDVAIRSAQWQASRIERSGEVSTQGNSRVGPGGESFLGRAKDVDVPFVVETLMIAYRESEASETLELARNVVQHYEQASRSR